MLPKLFTAVNSLSETNVYSPSIKGVKKITRQIYFNTRKTTGNEFNFSAYTPIVSSNLGSWDINIQ